MTDNDIMKDVRCCADGYCKGCSLQGKPNCRYTLLSFAWDTMYNQKAEIEELQAEIDKQYEQAKADILGNMSDGGTSCHWCIEQHRAEAIKEFAERLKAKVYEGQGYYSVISAADVDNLVKEMTEVEK